MYLRISCYCDACLNSSDLRVGVTTLLNTIQFNTIQYNLFVLAVLRKKLRSIFFFTLTISLYFHTVFNIFDHTEVPQ